MKERLFAFCLAFIGLFNLSAFTCADKRDKTCEPDVLPLLDVRGQGAVETAAVGEDEVFHWAYYSYSFPKEYGYVAKDSLNAESKTGMINLSFADLGTMGLSALAETLGEQKLIQLLLEEAFSGHDWSVFEAGEKDGAAYVIGTISVSSNGVSIEAAVVAVLKNDQLLLGMVYDSSIKRSEEVAVAFLNGITVHETLWEESSSQGYAWEINEEPSYSTLRFEACSKVIQIQIPNHYEVYMPGMGDDSIVPQLFGFSADEMEEYISKVNKQGIYALAIDVMNTDNTSVLRVIIEDKENNLGPLPKSGEYDQSVIRSHYDGIALMQGNYEVKHFNNRDFYVFPDYSNGYKIRTFFGAVEISILLTTKDSTYTENQMEEMWLIAQSISVDPPDSVAPISASQEQKTWRESTSADNRSGTEYEIPKLNGSIMVPDGYYVFGEDIPYTDQMCKDIGVAPSNMKSAMAFLQGQTLIVPSDKPYGESDHIYLKVKEKKYENITLSKLSLAEFNYLVAPIVKSFGVEDYEIVEGNGLRFFVFSYNQGLGNICRYATILNGHMVYVYMKTGDELITEQQKADLEFIALSIRHGL